MPSPQPTHSATLKDLYNPATRAFTEDRDFAKVQRNIDAALEILAQHPVPHAGPDELATHRRKWDMLHVTLHTTVYLQPAANFRTAKLVSHKRFSELRQLIPAALVHRMHARSVQLFTPDSDGPDTAYLPVQVVTNLVTAAVRLHCVDDGRAIAETWMRANGITEPSDEHTLAIAQNLAGTELDKLAMSYITWVLIPLADWQTAESFLRTNQVVSQSMRKHLLKNVKTARSSTKTQSAPPPPSMPSSTDATPTPTPTRGLSPSPSTSSVSTSSTRTARPLNSNALGLSAPQPAPSHFAVPRVASPSADSQATATPRPRGPPNAPSPSLQDSRRTAESASASSVARSPSRTRSIASTSTGARHLRLPSSVSDILTILRSVLEAQLARLGINIRHSNVVLFIVFVLFPFVAGAWRLRKRASLLLAPASAAGAGSPAQAALVGVFPALDPAQAARARLASAGVGWYSGTLNALVDVVRMASGGLA